jgi:hypothetical protein
MKMMSCHSIIVSLVISFSHLSHWAWNKGYHRYFKVCLMPWHTLRRYQLATIIYICKYLILMSWLYSLKNNFSQYIYCTNKLWSLTTIQKYNNKKDEQLHQKSRWTEVLAKGMQFLFLFRHSACRHNLIM